MPSGMYARVGLCPMTAREWGLAAGSAAPCRCQRNECVNESPVSVIARWLKQRLDVDHISDGGNGRREFAPRAEGTGTVPSRKSKLPVGQGAQRRRGNLFPLICIGQNEDPPPRDALGVAVPSRRPGTGTTFAACTDRAIGSVHV